MRYKVVTPVPILKDKYAVKTKWTQIGSAWSDDVEGKITVALSALPFRSEYMYLFPIDKELNNADE